MIKRIFPLFIFLSLVFSSVLAAVAAGEPSTAGPPGLTLVTADPSGVTVSLSTPKFDLREIAHRGERYQQLSVPGYEQNKTPGEPSLPQRSTLIGVPPGARVWVEVLSTDTRTQGVPFPIEPAPAPALLQDDLQPGEWQAPTESAGYLADHLYPAQPAALLEEAWIRDQRVVRLSLAPFQYNPAQQELLWHRQLQVRVHFQLDAATQAQQTCSEDCGEPGPFDRLLEHNLLNAAQARAWRGRPAAQSTELTASPTDAETRYKIVVDQDGLYQLTYEDLDSLGVDFEAIVDLDYLHLTSQGRDIAYFLEAGGDGSFDPGDRLLFYGEQFKGDHLAQVYADSMENWTWLCPTVCDLAGILEKYTDENVYWLTIESSPGLQMPTGDGFPGGATVPDHYTATVHLEESHAWYSFHFLTEDTWFWERLQNGSTANETYSYTVDITSPAATVLTATVSAGALARSNNQHHTQFFLNDVPQPVDDYVWQGKIKYEFEAEVPQTDLIEGENELILNLVSTYQDIYFDWFEVSYGRDFQAEGDQLRFSYTESGPWQFQVEGLTSDTVMVFDITDPLTPTLIVSPTISDAGGSYTAAFERTLSSPGEYLVAGDSAVMSPKVIQSYTPEDFQGINGTEYVFIAHPELLTETQRLAGYREGRGISTRVVSATELYDQYNYGIYHPIAVKNFLENAFDPAQLPSYVTLVGGGHWNMKGYPDYYSPPVYMPPNLAFVDPWQGEVDSVNLLAAVSGDDIFPDVYIARIPANSSTELATVIDKTIAYEAAPTQDWMRQIVFITDDTPDPAGDFVGLAEGMVTDYLDRRPALGVDRIYLDDYSPETITQVVTDTLNTTGAALVNYIGHSTVNFWAHNILRADDVSGFTNGDQLPVLLSMTCLDGYWVHPGSDANQGLRTSLAEGLLAAPDKGAVATFSATGLGVATGHDFLHRGFYNALFELNEWGLGAAAQNAKLNLFTNGSSDDLIHTFTVFGDPALQIRMSPVPYGIFIPAIRD